MEKVELFIDEKNNLCINCDGVCADLETNLGIEDIINLRKHSIDPLIIFENILQQIAIKDQAKTQAYDNILTKLITFFANVFGTENIKVENNDGRN